MTVLFVLFHLLILLLLTTTSFSLGRLLTQGLCFEPAAVTHDAPPSTSHAPAILLAEVSVAAAVGLGSLGLLGLALGLAGGLTPTVVLGLVATLHLAALPHWKRLTAHLNGHLRASKWSLYTVIVASLGSAFLVLCLVLTLYPPSTFDATMYHLPYAKLFGEEGRVVFASDLRYPVFPQLVDLLFTLMLLVADDVSASLVQTLSMLLVAGLLYDWGRQMISHRSGLWAAAIWLGNPLVLWNTRGALVDVSLALFVTTAAYAFARWRRHEQLGWLMVSAAGCAFAAGSKYHGVIFVGFFGLALAIDALQRRRWKPLVCGLAVVLLLALPWYARNYYHTGNPVFPFFTQVFGESEWSFHLATRDTWQKIPGSRADDDPALRLLTASFEVPEQLTRRVLRRADVSDLMKIPWRLSFQSRSDGRAPISPIYLFALPLVLLFTLRRPLDPSLASGKPYLRCNMACHCRRPTLLDSSLGTPRRTDGDGNGRTLQAPWPQSANPISISMGCWCR